MRLRLDESKKQVSISQGVREINKVAKDNNEALFVKMTAVLKNGERPDNRVVITTSNPREMVYGVTVPNDEATTKKLMDAIRSNKNLSLNKSGLDSKLDPPEGYDRFSRGIPTVKGF